MTTKTLDAKRDELGHCKMTVEGALKKLDGVSAAQVNLEAGEVDVTFDESKVTVDKMKEVIEDQGYDVEV